MKALRNGGDLWGSSGLGHLKSRVSIGVLVAVMAVFGAALTAQAGSTSLYGGSSCYGSGASGVVSSVLRSTTVDNVSPCNAFTDVYLKADTPPGYADLAGTWGYEIIYFATSAPSINGTHNLCHTECNGNVGTSYP